MTVERQTPVAYSGYGAIAALYNVLTASTGEILKAFGEGAGVFFDNRPYLAIADGMREGIEAIPSTVEWEDARTQFLALIERHRDIVSLLPPTDMDRFRAAVAEYGEMLSISRIAIDRLGQGLGLKTE
jgi:hypothetical protein